MTDEADVLSLDVKLTHGLYSYTENIALVLLSVRACPAECEVARICVSRSPAHTATDFIAAGQLTCQWLDGV